ncbi:MAG TPA: GspMb/PilO family protein [Burkholderiaceae bacterium]
MTNETLTQRRSKQGSEPLHHGRADFAAPLLPSADAHQFVQRLQSAGNANNVTLTSVSTWEAASSPHKFGRAGVSADLRGSYPQIKSVLGEVLGRSPNLVLQGFFLKRRGQPTEIEAHADFVLLSRPGASL